MLTKYLIGALAAALILTGWTAWTRDRALTKARTTIATLEAASDHCASINHTLRGEIARIAQHQADAIARAREAERQARAVEAEREDERQQQAEATRAIQRELADLAATECSDHPARPGFVDRYNRLLNDSPGHLGD